MTRPESRFAAVSRRTALTGVLGAALLAAAGCTNDDASLPGAGSTSPTVTPPESAPVPSASGSATSGGALPASALLSVSFTFAASAGGGPSRNPYVAVWIEDPAGGLIKTVALWHEDRGGQDRWLSEMKAYSVLNAADAQTTSSATRQPGTYAVQWDGSTAQGGRASVGTYRLFVEAAREHGPYELIQQDITLGTKATTFALTPSGELTAASAAYTV